MRTITPRALVLEGFKSYSSRVEVAFDADVGMVLVAGDNRAEPRLAANDCGKSTLLHALEWCLYGSPVRGLRIGELVSWGADRVSVEFALDVDGARRVVSRSGPPERVYVDGEQVDQEVVVALVGRTRRQFLNSVIYGQAAPLFVDLPIPERGDLLDEVLDLQMWMRAASRAGIRADTLSARLTRLGTDRARVEGALSALEPEEVLREREAAWEDDRRTRIAALAEQVAVCDAEITALENPSPEEGAWEEERRVALDETDRTIAVRRRDLRRTLRPSAGESDWEAQRSARIEATEAALSDIQATLADLSAPSPPLVLPDVDALRAAADAARARVDALVASAAAREQELARVLSDVAFFEETGECPTCRQEIAPGVADEHLADLRARRAELETEIADTTSRRAEADIAVAAALAAVTAARDAIRDRESQAQALRERIRTTRREADLLSDRLERERSAGNPHVAARLERVAGIEREIVLMGERREALRTSANPHVAARRERELAARKALADLSARLSALESEPNPHEATRLRAAAERERLAGEVAQIERREASLKSRLAQTDYWRGSGFRRVRLFCMRRALAQLDLDTMGQARSLGLAGWQIGYSTETETKAGSQRLGVQVQVQSPLAGASFSALGGGVGQRVRLCTALGVGRLIERWCGARWRFEAFDEPTSWLSDAGVEDLLELLRARADQEDKAIWVMDHRGLQNVGFSRVLTVVKGPGGSTVEVR